MAPAEAINPDSLKSLLPGAELRQRVMILNELANYYAPLDFDSSIIYSAQAMRIATVYGNPEGIALARLYTGNAYYYKMEMKLHVQKGRKTERNIYRERLPRLPVGSTA